MSNQTIAPSPNLKVNVCFQSQNKVCTSTPEILEFFKFSVSPKERVDQPIIIGDLLMTIVRKKDPKAKLEVISE